MVKKFIPAIAVIMFLGGCSALKQVDLSSNKPITPSITSDQDVSPKKVSEIKFLNNISASSQTSAPDVSMKSSKKPSREEVITPKKIAEQPKSTSETNEDNATSENSGNVVALKTKYAEMLNTNPDNIHDLKLFEYIDDWYGTPYRLGGTTKNGVDCSAFVQSLFASVYGISLPRTSQYQYKATKRISTTQLREGDLLFFHTRRNHGSITHVGVYLQNNKFVQASSSGGVKISDMYDPYYVQHLVGAGRVVDDK